jgi:PAS domain S-box-containing protein
MPGKRAKPTERSAARAPAGAASFYLDEVGAAFGTLPISMSSMIDTTSDAILFVDVERRIRFWYRGASEMFGYPREEATGAYYDLLLPEDLKRSGELETLERMTRDHGMVSNYLTRRVGKNGEEKIVSLSRSALRDARGEIVGWTAILRDATDQVRVERELSRARSLAMVGQLAANVAHEIKNPLAGIHGATQILLHECAPDDPSREILVRIANEIRRLDATVRDLLRFAKPESAKLEMRDLREYLTEFVRELREDARYGSIDFQFSGEAVLTAPIDERLMHQVFLNLFENARDALEGSGNVDVVLRAEGSHAVVEVADSGPGINDDKLERVFEPFYTSKPRGTGLGLAICRKNIEAHGGAITVANDRAGGARFRIRLPRQLPSLHEKP